MTPVSMSNPQFFDTTRLEMEARRMRAAFIHAQTRRLLAAIMGAFKTNRPAAQAGN